MRNAIVLLALFTVAVMPAVAQTSSAAPGVATATPVASEGKMLIGADHSRLGSVVRVESDGSAAIIFDGHMVTVPASTLRMAEGKLTTSLSRHDLTTME